ncbi:unnamed protein product [Kuraishia capsulata CBS 1993]|uniref:Small nuclear ribonucleoprotein E n=1 Tax=Kuraishia capsulata CBS 1993 TaxID=1382522 RepID=W6MMB6_9ASCO|nr:uncharacterized protein KUCA_T00003660001 [Kuraishia capsulata CBS 1993]CDK27681.1 unnamed protein product [Kuraishia capsulata CBS 1993]
MSGRRQQKVMVPPINFLFKLLQQQSLSSIWLYEQTESKINGHIRGFDEFMNVVVDDAVEVNSKTKEERKLGRILLKGDNITLISSLEM